MSEEKLGFVGKQVKDIYGTYIGKVVGIITEIDGEIETVGVDTGSGGLRQLPYEQLVIQGDYVFFIPKWRLDAQRLLRQKSLTLKRIKALQDIVAENDGMKEDAELVYIKYEKKLSEIEASEKQVNDTLNARLSELDAEARNIKAVLFDAKLQFRSNEMKEETYQQIKVQTDELIEHISNERTEISNVRAKMAANTLENISTESAPAVAPAKEAPAAEPSHTDVEVAPVQQVTTTSEEEKPVAVSANGAEQETSWLNQVITK
ncbi:MAG: CdvA-like protein [Thermoproteota archaeon]